MATTQKTLVVFRNDDFSAYSDLALENEIFRIFQERHIAQTVGVVPFMSKDPHNEREEARFPLVGNPAAVAWLKDRLAAGEIEVALHGCYHQTNLRHPRAPVRPGQRPFPGPGQDTWSSYDPARRDLFSEFRDLDYREQFQRIQKGRDCLHDLLDISVATFVPPWNRYDDNTVLALERNGLKVISGKFSTRRNSVRNVLRKTAPLLIECTADLDTFPQALQQAADFHRDGGQWALVVLVYHSWMFRSRPYQFRLLEIALSACAEQRGAQAVTLREAAEMLPEDFRRLTALKAEADCHLDQLNSLRRLFRMKPSSDSYRYLYLDRRSYYRRRIRQLRAQKLALYFLEIVVGFLVGTLLGKRLFFPL